MLPGDIPHLHQYLVLLVFLNVRHSIGCEVVFYVDLIFTALVTNEHHFTCLLVINIFSIVSIYFSHLSIYCCIL